MKSFKVSGFQVFKVPGSKVPGSKVLGSKVLGSKTLGFTVLGVLVVALWASVVAQELPPELTAPVNDFAQVIPAEYEQQLDELSRKLLAASGDTIVVATVDTFQPYADLPSYAVKMFENRGRGIGQKGKDNGLLVVLAVQDRAVRVEVGYDLEGIITDGFAGETSRETMVPFFRSGDYGGGLLAGAARIAQRIAQARNVTLDNVPRPAAPVQPSLGGDIPWIVFLIIAMVIWNMMRSMFGPRRGRRRGRWNSHVGPFGAGFGGGGWSGGSGGFGGGFGGFGGGRSGGGGGGASW